MTKKTTATHAVATPNFLDNLASAFVEANKDYFFSNIPDRNVLRGRAAALCDLLEALAKISIHGKMSALTRMATCYALHSTDTAREKAETLKEITGSSGLCSLLETLGVRSEDIDIWADFMGVLDDQFEE